MVSGTIPSQDTCVQLLGLNQRQPRRSPTSAKLPGKDHIEASEQNLGRTVSRCEAAPLSGSSGGLASGQHWEMSQQQRRPGDPQSQGSMTSVSPLKYSALRSVPNISIDHCGKNICGADAGQVTRLRRLLTTPCRCGAAANEGMMQAKESQAKETALCLATQSQTQTPLPDC